MIRTTSRLCCHLRWRELAESGPAAASPCSAEGFFCCNHTLSHLGPDGRVADDSSCRAGRVCFEAICPPEELEAPEELAGIPAPGPAQTETPPPAGSGLGSLE
jgi:hypothetical protein